MESYTRSLFKVKGLTVPTEEELAALDAEWKKFQEMKQSISPKLFEDHDIFYRYHKEVERT